MHGMVPTQPTQAKTAVESFPVDTQYLALIVLKQKLQFCARNSSDILYEYPWFQESGALKHELAKHVDITSLNTSEISGNKNWIVNLLKHSRLFSVFRLQLPFNKTIQLQFWKSSSYFWKRSLTDELQQCSEQIPS